MTTGLEARTLHLQHFVPPRFHQTAQISTVQSPAKTLPEWDWREGLQRRRTLRHKSVGRLCRSHGLRRDNKQGAGAGAF